MFENFFLYMLTGAFAGLLSGLLGIGGGIIVVPSLVWIYEAQGMPYPVLMHFAAGTSLASMVVTTTVSFLAHRKRGVDVWPIFHRMIIFVAMGVVVGAMFANLIHSHILTVVFGILILVIALRTLFVHEVPEHHALPGPVGMGSISFIIGGKSGLLGIGGGVLTIPFLRYCNVPLRQAVGVSTLCSLTIAMVGTLSLMITGQGEPGAPQWTTGYVYWPAVLGIILLSPLFAPIGVALSHRLPVKVLQRIFAVFLLFTGLRMLL